MSATAVTVAAGVTPQSSNNNRLARAAEYREIAEGLRELARRVRSLDIRRELFTLGIEYDRRADRLKSEYFADRSRSSLAVGSCASRMAESAPSEPSPSNDPSQPAHAGS